MKIRTVRPADHDTVSAWWKARRHAIIPLAALPKFGVIAERTDGTPLAAAWCYLSGTQFAYISWAVTNPNANAREAHEALTLVLTELDNAARQLGAGYVFATSGSTGLSKLLERLGWRADPKPHKLYVKGEIDYGA